MGRTKAVRVVLIVLAAATAFTPTQSLAAPPERTQIVIPLTGEIAEACDELVRYTGGEVRITEQEVITASGGRIIRYHAHTVGATAVGLESGLVYRDHTTFHQHGQGNATWYQTQFQDGSHGVNVVVRVRLFAPGSDASTFVDRFDFHLRRVDGLDVDPRMVHERSSSSCV
ncbi:hypothetical protein BH18ACT8_BH18ACT8_14780 [soil metagenome]